MHSVCMGITIVTAVNLFFIGQASRVRWDLRRWDREDNRIVLTLFYIIFPIKIW